MGQWYWQGDDTIPLHAPDGHFLYLMWASYSSRKWRSVDSTALLMLIQVVEGLRSQGVEFYMSNMIGPVRDRIQGSDLVPHLPQSQMFATVEDAIAFYDEGIHRRMNIAAQWYPR